MIIALIGSTATGKTDLALSLAKKTGAQIMSCDSLLVYKEMNVGTAKPTEIEMGSVIHHGINLCSANETFTAADYVRYAKPLIENLLKEKTPVIIVGGTGFYLKALLNGVWDAPPAQPELREKYEAYAAEKGVIELHKILEIKDPARAAKIHFNDVYRVIRALEIIDTTGAKLSEQLEKKSQVDALQAKVPVFGVTRDSIELERRIVERMNKMFAAGLVNETKALLEKYAPDFLNNPDSIPRPLLSVGYREVIEFLNGRMTLSECRERVVISTRQLAKKQRTFFNGMDIEVEWFSLPAQESEAEEKLLSKLV